MHVMAQPMAQPNEAVTAYLGLGSNLGDREENVRRALQHLAQGSIQLGAVSSFIETAPVGYLDQPFFLNACAQIQTTLSPQALLEEISRVEQALGRVRQIPNGPRTIDIDILLYADWIVTTPQLMIPHPRLHKRLFVLGPLAEIAPQAVHPGREVTVAELYALCVDGVGVASMEPSKSIQQITTSAAETEALGYRLAEQLTPPYILGLVGDLGSGKTVFAKGVGRGLGVPATVTSPTFVLMNRYQGTRGLFNHIDLYRLSEGADLDALGLADWLADPQALTLIEWVDRLAVPPAACSVIRFTVPSPDTRILSFPEAFEAWLPR